MKSKFTSIKLGDLVEVRGGKRLPKGKPYSQEKTKHPYLRVCDFSRGGIRMENLKYLSPEIQKTISRYTISSDDVYISIAGSIGIVGTIPENLSGANLTENAAKLSIKDKKSLDKNYLSYYLNYPGQKYIEFQIKATSQPKLALFRIEQIPIPLPPLSDQKRIVEILDAADALRVKRREAIAQLDALLQSTFLTLFGDPATNPMGFPVEPLSKYYINKKDGTKCGPFGSALKKNELVTSGVPVWNMDNIEPSGRMSLPFRMWISEAKYRELEAYSVINGDIIISRAGTVGKMCVANPDCDASIISTNLIRIRLNPYLLPIYFVSLMTYFKGRVGRLKIGPDGAFTHMSTKVLDTLNFPYPPLGLQNHFATIVKSIEKQKAHQRAHLAELDTLFASLQSRAFRGEL